MKTLAFWVMLVPAVLSAQDDLWDEEDWGNDEQAAVWSGFLELGLGTRLQSDALIEERQTLGEMRLRLETEWAPGKYSIGFKADGRYDAIEEQWRTEIRDLTLAFALLDNTDVRIGRQVQTWGTGDLVFLNDLFPKDFVSFFAGRDDEYLKAPGNAVRVTRYSPAINIDFVWTPDFEPDVYLTGERFSFFSPLAGMNVAPRPPLAALEPGNSAGNGEFALRLFNTVKGREFALYAYRGFFKQPSALTASFEPTFAPLTALGASLRQTLGPGLFNSEASYYLSRDDRNGTNPRVPNDQLRFLAGYEWEAKPNFNVGLQYYLEWTLDHDALIANSLAAQFEPDEYRQLLTNRLTWRVGRDRHRISLFTFFSPSDRDAYLRPTYTYRHSDAWAVTAGGNLFLGDEPQTFFSQLQDASNLYARVRYIY